MDLYWVDPAFLRSEHGSLGCTSCHGGDPSSPHKVGAHLGLVRDPSQEAGRNCSPCHEQIVRRYETSLHATVRGFETVLRQRAGDRWSELETVYRESCSGCHANCGHCHLARHPSGGGGLLAGHRFLARPPADKACGSCHGGRVTPEFFGAHEGQPADVHFARAQMDCFSCHDPSSFHGSGTAFPDRHASLSRLSCLDCHGEAFGTQTAVEAHRVHGRDLQCQICHSALYKGCYECHLATGSRSRLQFKIGRNPRPDRPYRFTLLRHIPTLRDTFESKLKDALPWFDSVPNWKPTSPHALQRITYRNRDCNGCHGNPRIFLRLEDLSPQDPRANEGLLVPAIPEKLPPQRPR